MPYEFYNPNPKNQKVGDCAVRAICKALGTDWQDAYVSLCAEGLVWKDMPSSNFVWGNYLKRFGFIEHIISSVCPNCITVSEFAKDHPEGRYVLVCQNHTLAVVDGIYYDAWDSGNEADDIWMVMDELMQTIQILNPRLYRATLDRIKGD